MPVVLFTKLAATSFTVKRCEPTRRSVLYEPGCGTMMARTSKLIIFIFKHNYVLRMRAALNCTKFRVTKPVFFQFVAKKPSDYKQLWKPAKVMHKKVARKVFF